MVRLIAVLAGLFFVAASPSFAQMMDKHMEEHVGEMHKQKEAKKEAKDFTRETEAAGVTVKATYKNPGEKTPVFNVSLDTHAVDLDRYRLEDLTVLMVDGGVEFRPAVISQTGSGHHREVTLIFRDADIRPAVPIVLIIRGIEGVKERVFSFEPERSGVE